MPEQIGNAGNIAMAWAERIMFALPPDNERGRDLNEFVERRFSLVGPGDSFDLSNHTEGLGLSARKLNHVVRQTQPPRLAQRRLVNRNSGPVQPTIKRTHSDAGTVLPAPAENISLPNNVSRREIQTRGSVQLAPEEPAKKGAELSPRMNLAKIADKVYRLMQSDLILERERTTEMGG